MAKQKTVKQTEGVIPLFSGQIGNGSAQIMTNHSREVIQIAPVIAPMTDRRGIEKADEKPRFSLNVDGQILVAGVDDVMMHGKMGTERRRNSIDRYAQDDYRHLLDILLLHGFADMRGDSDGITPQGILTVPASVYNNPDMLAQLEAMLFVPTKTTLVDYDGCELRVSLQRNNIRIRQEAAFDLWHFTHNGDGTPRKGYSMKGTILMIDWGFLTLQTSLFMNGEYIRDASHTFDDLGMIQVVERVQRNLGTGANLSYLDLNMQNIAGKPYGVDKYIDIAPGVSANIAPVYDPAMASLAAAIIDRVNTAYRNQRISLVTVTGGGKFHGHDLLEGKIANGAKFLEMPNAEQAGVIGAYYALKQSLGI